MSPERAALYYCTIVLVMFPAITGALLSILLFYPALSGGAASGMRALLVVCNVLLLSILVSGPWAFMRNRDATILQRALVTAGSLSCFAAVELAVWNKMAQQHGITAAPALLPNSIQFLNLAIFAVAVATVELVCMANIRSTGNCLE